MLTNKDRILPPQPGGVQTIVQPTQPGVGGQVGRPVEPGFSVMSNSTTTNSGKDPLNQLQYLKQQWENAGDNKGLQTWASNEAQKYYSQLDPGLAKQIQGMNASQLANFRTQQPAQQQQQPNPNQMIEDMFNRQRQAQLAQLQASRDKAVGQLNQQRGELAPQYQGMRNQSDVVANQNAQRLREIMASNGLGASGENVSASVGLQNARQNALNSLNLQEQQQHNDINRRISDLNNPAEENALMAALEAEKSRALLGQFNADRQFGLQEADLLGSYKGQQTLAALNAQRQFALGEAGLTGIYNGQQTLAAQGQQWQQNFAQDQFAYQQVRDQIKDTQWQKQFDEDLRRFGLQHALQKQVSNAQISQAAANQALAQAKFSYQQQRDAIGDQQWQQQFQWQQEQANNKQVVDTNKPLSSSDLNNYIQVIDGSNFIDSFTKEVRDPNGLRRYIISMGLPDSATDQMLLRYGLPLANNSRPR